MKKTVKVNNTQVMNIVEGFNRMKKDDINLPAILTYKLVRNIRTLEPTYTAITETKNTLIKKHQKTEEGLKQGTEEFDSFLEEFTTVLEETNEFELDMSDSGMLEGVELSLADMLVLEFMMED